MTGLFSLKISGGGVFPVVLMLLTVGMWASAPLVVALLEVSGSPFLFAASMEAGALLAYLAFLLLFHRGLLSDRSVLRVLGRHLMLRDRRLGWLLLGVVSGLAYVFFILSTRFVDVSVSAVLFDGLWPSVMVVMMALLYRGVGRYLSLTPWTALLLLLAMAGCSLVVFSQEGVSLGGRGLLVLLGVALAVLASFTGPLACCLFRWATSLVDALRAGVPDLRSCSVVRLELFGGACVAAIVAALSLLVNLGVGCLLGERLPQWVLLAGMLTGAFVYSMAGLTWRLSNLGAVNLGVNALGYLSPVLTLGLLWVFRQVQVSHTLLLLAGALLVVTANVLINSGGEVGARLRALPSRFPPVISRGAVGGETLALFCMLAVVVLGTAAPLGVSLSGATRFPFFFAAAMQLGGVLGYLVFLFLVYRVFLLDRRVFRVVRGHLLGGPGIGTFWFLLVVVSGLEYVLFVWSVRFVDVSVSAVFFEGFWPLLVILMLYLLYRGTGRYPPVTFGMGVMLLLAFAGFFLVVAGHEGGAVDVAPATLVGVGLAVGASFFGALACCLFRWGSSLADSLVSAGVVSSGVASRFRLEMFCVSVGVVTARALSGLLMLSIGWLLGEVFALLLLAIGLLTGFLIYTMESLAWRVSNVVTRNPGVNAIGYLGPLADLAALWAVARVTVGSPALLLLGVLLVVISNTLINAGGVVRPWLGSLRRCLSGLRPRGDMWSLVFGLLCVGWRPGISGSCRRRCRC